ncbi:MAG: hypothetical protein ABIP93_14405 [Gemmatimonadaceae bacterium]
MRRVASLLVMMCSVAPVANAQLPVAEPAPSASVPVGAPLVEPDSSPLFVRPDGASLRPGASTYELSLVRPGQTAVPLGVRTVQITDAASGGVPGWLIAESRTGSAVPTSDSLWVTRADLSPLRWAATVDHTLLGASFTRDSVFGGVQNYRGRSSFGVALPPGALITAGMIDGLLSLLPLRAGYRATASLLLVEPGAPRALRAELRVEREERVRVGAFDVDCWVVALRAGVMEQRLWVIKESPRVVRTEQVLSSGVLTAVLRQ